MTDGEARTLAIETSGRAGSLCVSLGPRVLGRADIPAQTRHAAGLHVALDRLTREQGWAPDSLDEVYVSAGPGSFTGVRVGVTVARTLAWSTGAKLVRVPTVDALAHNALAADPRPTRVVVVLDAKRRQIFGALFEWSAAEQAFVKRVDSQMTDPLAFLRDAGPAGEVAVLGEGVEFHREAIAEAGVRVLPAALWPGRAESVLAAGLRMAAAGDYCEPGDCVPLYVRLPEPEEKWRLRRGLSILD